MMVEATATTTKANFTDVVEEMKEVKEAAAEVIQQINIDSSSKTTMLISVEDNVKKLVSGLAKKEKLPSGLGVESNPEDYSHLPNSINGVMVYYLIKGIRSELGYEFETAPKCLTYNQSKEDKKKSGKKRLLTREEKNELLSKTQMSYYDEKISSGEMSIETAMNEVKTAYEKVKSFKDIGYILPAKKSEYPYWEKKNED